MSVSTNAFVALTIGLSAAIGLFVMCAISGEWFGLAGLPAALIGFHIVYGNACHLSVAERFSNAWCGAAVYAFIGLMLAAIVRMAFD